MKASSISRALARACLCLFFILPAILGMQMQSAHADCNGNGICEPGLGEDVASCYDCFCGDQVCDVSEDPFSCFFDCEATCDPDCESTLPGSVCTAISPTEAVCMRGCHCDDPLGFNCRGSDDDCSDMTAAFGESYCCTRDVNGNSCQPVSHLPAGSASCGYVPVCFNFSPGAEFTCMAEGLEGTLYTDNNPFDDFTLGCGGGEGGNSFCFSNHCPDPDCTDADAITGIDYCCAAAQGDTSGGTRCIPRSLGGAPNLPGISGSPYTCDVPPSCNPVCQNGGTCTGFNACSCPPEWTGPSCETPAACTTPECQAGQCTGDGDCDAYFGQLGAPPGTGHCVDGQCRVRCAAAISAGGTCTLLDEAFSAAFCCNGDPTVSDSVCIPVPSGDTLDVATGQCLSVTPCEGGDCGTASLCGDGLCDPTVFQNACGEAAGEPIDCVFDCGATVCGGAITQNCCGDGICNPMMEASSPGLFVVGAGPSLYCPQDCSCGDGVCDGSEEDVGIEGSCFPGACAADCQPTCGDGVCHRDVNKNNYVCTIQEINGDPQGDVFKSECPSDCFCGNGTCDLDETTESCRADCPFDVCGCGDGTLDPGEECDDGNTQDGDGCSATCTTGTSCADTCVHGSCDEAGICHCESGWAGEHCDQPPTCEPPCLNGGACVAPNTCQCPPGWLGTHCEFNVDAACPCSGPFPDQGWKNHGAYVSCVSHAAQGQPDHGRIVSDAAHRNCPIR